MWSTILARFIVRPWARWTAGVVLAALTAALFILNLRRAGERVGRSAARLQHLERHHDIQRQMLETAAGRPRSRDDLLDRLRDGGF